MGCARIAQRTTDCYTGHDLPVFNDTWIPAMHSDIPQYQALTTEIPGLRAMRSYIVQQLKLNYPELDPPGPATTPTPVPGVILNATVVRLETARLQAAWLQSFFSAMGASADSVDNAMRASLFNLAFSVLYVLQLQDFRKLTWLLETLAADGKTEEDKMLVAKVVHDTVDFIRQSWLANMDQVPHLYGRSGVLAMDPNLAQLPAYQAFLAFGLQPVLDDLLSRRQDLEPTEDLAPPLKTWPSPAAGTSIQAATAPSLAQSLYPIYSQATAPMRPSPRYLGGPLPPAETYTHRGSPYGANLVKTVSAGRMVSGGCSSLVPNLPAVGTYYTLTTKPVAISLGYRSPGLFNIGGPLFGETQAAISAAADTCAHSALSIAVRTFVPEVWEYNRLTEGAIRVIELTLDTVVTSSQPCQPGQRPGLTIRQHLHQAWEDWVQRERPQGPERVLRRPPSYAPAVPASDPLWTALFQSPVGLLIKAFLDSGAVDRAYGPNHTRVSVLPNGVPPVARHTAEAWYRLASPDSRLPIAVGGQWYDGMEAACALAVSYPNVALAVAVRHECPDVWTAVMTSATNDVLHEAMQKNSLVRTANRQALDALTHRLGSRGSPRPLLPEALTDQVDFIHIGDKWFSLLDSTLFSWRRTDATRYHLATASRIADQSSLLENDDPAQLPALSVTVPPGRFHQMLTSAGVANPETVALELSVGLDAYWATPAYELNILPPVGARNLPVTLQQPDPVPFSSLPHVLVTLVTGAVCMEDLSVEPCYACSPQYLVLKGPLGLKLSCRTPGKEGAVVCQFMSNLFPQDPVAVLQLMVRIVFPSRSTTDDPYPGYSTRLAVVMGMLHRYLPMDGYKLPTNARLFADPRLYQENLRTRITRTFLHTLGAYSGLDPRSRIAMALQKAQDVEPNPGHLLPSPPGQLLARPTPGSLIRTRLLMAGVEPNPGPADEPPDPGISLLTEGNLHLHQLLYISLSAPATLCGPSAHPSSQATTTLTLSHSLPSLVSDPSIHGFTPNNSSAASTASTLYGSCDEDSECAEDAGKPPPSFLDPAAVLLALRSATGTYHLTAGGKPMLDALLDWATRDLPFALFMALRYGNPIQWRRSGWAGFSDCKRTCRHLRRTVIRWVKRFQLVMAQRPGTQLARLTAAPSSPALDPSSVEYHEYLSSPQLQFILQALHHCTDLGPVPSSIAEMPTAPLNPDLRVAEYAVEEAAVFLDCVDDCFARDTEAASDAGARPAQSSNPDQAARSSETVPMDTGDTPQCAGDSVQTGNGLPLSGRARRARRLTSRRPKHQAGPGWKRHYLPVYRRTAKHYPVPKPVFQVPPPKRRHAPDLTLKLLSSILVKTLKTTRMRPASISALLTIITTTFIASAAATGLHHQNPSFPSWQAPDAAFSSSRPGGTPVLPPERYSTAGGTLYCLSGDVGPALPPHRGANTKPDSVLPPPTPTVTTYYGTTSPMDAIYPAGVPAVLPHSKYHKTEHGWVLGNHPDFTKELQQAFTDAILAQKQTFAYSMEDLPGYSGDVPPFRIILQDPDKPCSAKPRPYSPLEKRVMAEKLEPLMDVGIITECTDSRYSCNTVLPAKKDENGNWTDYRACHDYRLLNARVDLDPCRPPLPEDIFRAIGTAGIFSKLDLRNGFLQLPVQPEDMSKTAFWYGNKLMMYTRCPFGLKNMPAHFQRVMDYEIQKAGLYHCCRAFLDDLIIWSATPEEHIEQVTAVLKMLQACGLMAHPDKSIFGADVVEYLGHNVSAAGLSPHHAKTSAIRALPEPTNISELRHILGFCGYYRGYLPGYSQIAAPLHSLLAKDVAWTWGTPQQAAFDKLKDGLCQEGLVLRRPDESKPYVLYTDFSNKGIAAVLAQHGEQGEYMVACISRSLNKHERNYSSYKGEMLAAVWACKSFRHYLQGVQFRLVTDHDALRYLMTNEHLVGQYQRWALSLQEYDFTIEHRAGSEHHNVDVPSRYPVPDSTDCTEARLDGPAHVEPAADSATIRALLAISTISREAQAAASNSFTTSSLTTITTASELLEGNNGYCADGISCPPSTHSHDLLPYKRDLLHQWSAWQVCNSLAQRQDAMPACTTTLHTTLGGTINSINSSPVSPTTISQAQYGGVVLYEPFGGMCAGLECLLRSGIPVRQYIYSDTDPAAQAVALHRLQHLGAMYPDLLPSTAYQNAFTALPMDVRSITNEHLTSAVRKHPGMWMVIGGWECQDLSPAGKGKGLQGSRSDTFYDLLRIVGHLQQTLGSGQLLYILENTHMQSNWKADAPRSDFQFICEAIGTPVVLDAVQVGSHAHRLRNYWTNLADANQLSAVISTITRPDHDVNKLLHPHATTQVAITMHPEDYYPANTIGQPLKVLPTLVATLGSYSFRDGSPGMVMDTHTHHLREPTVPEREAILGYPVGCTAAPGITDQQRHAITGRCMDAWAMQALMGLSLALQRPPLQAAVATITHKSLLQDYPVGSHMLIRQGWTPGSALGTTTSRPRLLHPVTSINATQTSARRVHSLHCPGLGYDQSKYNPSSKPSNLHKPILFTRPVQGPPLISNPAAISGATTSPPPPSADLQVVMSALHLDASSESNSSSAGGGKPDQSDSAPQSDSSLAAPSHLCSLTAAVSPEPSTLDTYRTNFTLDQAAAAADGPPPPNGADDVWSDDATMRYLINGELPSAIPEIRRVKRRAKGYTFQDDTLLRCMADGTTRMVPSPDQRPGVMQEIHDQCGHFGERRTVHLVLLHYWWRGLYADVRRMVKDCVICDRAHANTSGDAPGDLSSELTPLPIQGLFYRWHVDLCGPFPTTPLGNSYVMVCVESFSKWVELIPIPSKLASTTSQAFLLHVLSRYGACAEVVTDQGGEFQGAFQDLMERALIDHRYTSAYHPQADGLAERCVQTLKRCLRKCCDQAENLSVWDTLVPWIALGYRASPQASTKLSPYEMLYATRPVIPPAVKEKLQGTVDLDDPEAAAQSILQRAEVIQRNSVIAGHNLKIAQHRDTQWYARVRTTGYVPKARKFEVGDFVYVRFGVKQQGLVVSVRQDILRVLEARPSGVLLLQGKCGGTMPVHCTRCALCHLSDIDPTLDTTLFKPPKSLPCEICGDPEQDALMLLCDGCNTGWHTFCLLPPLLKPPAGTWLCPRCLTHGITIEAVEQDLRLAKHQKKLTGVQLKDQAAEALAGRLVLQQVRDKVTGKSSPLYGRVIFRGATYRPKYFQVKYHNGTTKYSLTPQQVGKYLMPEDARLPVDIIIPSDNPVVAAAAAISHVSRPLPSTYELNTSDGVGSALQQLMPGPWPPAHVTKLCDAIKRQPACLPTLPEEVESLLDCVNLSSFTTIVDPWAGTQNIAKVLRARGHRVVSCDIDPRHSTAYNLDALQPATYRFIRQQHGLDVIIMSPWFAALDLALPMAVKETSTLVCCHVPGHYITSPPPARQDWFRQLVKAGRLHLHLGLPRSSMGMRCVWIIVASTPELLQQLVRLEYRHNVGFSIGNMSG